MRLHHVLALSSFVLFAAWSPPPIEDEATEITDPNAITYSEESFTYPDDEEDFAVGEVYVDYQELEADGIVDGFVQVLAFDDDSTEGTWIVRNLPILSPGVTPGESMYFPFPETSLRAKGPRGTINVSAFRTPTAVRRPPRPRPMPPPVVRNLNPAATNARGIALAANCLPNPTGSLTPAFDPKTNERNHLPGPERDSVEQDVNQCCPGGVSNSMEYLKQEQGVAVDQKLGTDNGPGIAGAPNTSRVARLDSYMGRAQGMALFPREVLDGKLKFIKAAGIDGNLDVKHWGKVCDRQGRSAEGDVTADGVTSTRSQSSCADFLKQEIDDEEDVELLVCWRGPSGQLQGHCVQVTGYDIANGELRVNIVEDHNQGFDRRTGTTAINGGVAPGPAGGHGIYHLRKQGGFLRVQNFHNAIVVNVISESKKP